MTVCVCGGGVHLKSVGEGHILEGDVASPHPYPCTHSTSSGAAAAAAAGYTAWGRYLWASEPLVARTSPPADLEGGPWGCTGPTQCHRPSRAAASPTAP